MAQLGLIILPVLLRRLLMYELVIKFIDLFQVLALFNGTVFLFYQLLVDQVVLVVVLVIQAADQVVLVAALSLVLAVQIVLLAAAVPAAEH